MICPADLYSFLDSTIGSSLSFLYNNIRHFWNKTKSIFLSQLALNKTVLTKEEQVVTLVIGLFIGALFGFIVAAIIARGKHGDQYDPLATQSPEPD